jgi:hypothetical protein
MASFVWPFGATSSGPASAFAEAVQVVEAAHVAARRYLEGNVHFDLGSLCWELLNQEPPTGERSKRTPVLPPLREVASSASPPTRKRMREECSDASASAATPSFGAPAFRAPFSGGRRAEPPLGIPLLGRPTGYRHDLAPEGRGATRADGGLRPEAKVSAPRQPQQGGSSEGGAEGDGGPAPRAKLRVECGQCGRRFRGRTELEAHERTHTGEKPLLCGVCGKSFAHCSNLRAHERTHRGEKPYPCPHPGCGKCFAHSTSLKEHLRSHTGEKPFACDFPGCGKCFAGQSNYRRHRKLHQRISLD